MSIIYDALQKVENKEADKPQAKVKEKKNFLWVLILVCVAVTLGFLFMQYSKKQAIAKGKEQKNITLAQAKTVPAPLPINPAKMSEASALEKPSEDIFTLKGIIYSQDNPIAIINGKIVKIKDKIEGFEVKQINPSSVELTKLSDNTPLNLTLK